MAQETPESVTTPTPERPSLTLTPKNWITLAVGIALLAVLLLGAAFAMKSLSTTYLFEGQYVSGKVMKLGMFGLKDKDVAVSGQLSDYAMGGNTRAAIVRNAETGAQDVVVLEPKEVQLTSDGIGKAAIAVSTDGAHVAFSRRADNQVGGDFAPQISRWEVVVVRTADNSVLELGQGFAPQFFTKGGVQYVLFTTRYGVSIADVATGAAKTLAFINPGVIDYAAIVSADGTYFAVPNPVSRAYDIFSLVSMTPEVDYTLHAVAPTRFISGAFSDNALMGVERNDDGSARLWKVPLTAGTPKGEVVTELPNNAHYRVVNK